MSRLYTAIHAFFGLFQWGTGMVDRYLFIVVMGIVSAYVALVLFKRFSRQQKLIRLRKRIWGTLLQIHLYPDRLRVLIASLLSVLADTIRSLMETIPPLIVICIPVMVVMLQVNVRCGYDTLNAGDTFTIKADISDGTALYTTDITTSPDIILETDALRSPYEGCILWRASVSDNPSQDNGTIWLIDRDGAITEKTVVTAKRLRTFEPVTVKWSVLSGFIHFAEGYIDGSQYIQSIKIDYPRAHYPFFGWHVDAIVLYVIVTLIAGLALKPLIGVAL